MIIQVFTFSLHDNHWSSEFPSTHAACQQATDQLDCLRLGLCIYWKRWRSMAAKLLDMWILAQWWGSRSLLAKTCKTWDVDFGIVENRELMCHTDQMIRGSERSLWWGRSPWINKWADLQRRLLALMRPTLISWLPLRRKEVLTRLKNTPAVVEHLHSKTLVVGLFNLFAEPLIRIIRQ